MASPASSLSSAHPSAPGEQQRLLLIAAVFWLGLLLGVSFLATPIKFQAPSLDLPTALDVGRVTFALFSRVELVLWCLLAGAALLSHAKIADLALVAFLAAVLLAQSLWLLPALDGRVEQIMAGVAPPHTGHHFFYVSAEGFKVLSLVLLAGRAFRSTGPTTGPKTGGRH